MPVCLTDQAKTWIAKVLQHGNAAIDATTGNGHDTLFLASLVGESGRVFAFDIQEEAISRARKRLTAAGMANRVRWYRTGHQHLTATVPDIWRSRIRAVMFNLGYLPSGNKAIITRPDTTLSALQQAIALLSPGGRMSVIVYTGHHGGESEAEGIRKWLRGYDGPIRWQTIVPDAKRSPPQLFLLEKKCVTSFNKSGKLYHNGCPPQNSPRSRGVAG